MKTFIGSLSAVLFISALSARPALSATIHVPADQPTIQDGIDASLDGDIILVFGGTYVESIRFFTKDITLQSEQGADVTVIDGNQSGSVVTIDWGVEVVIDGFTIRNGSGTHFPEDYTAKGGGIFCEYSSATIVNCTIIDNILIEDSPVGGGIYGWDSSLTIDNCTITENSAFSAVGGGVAGSGGGVCCKVSSLSVTNCTITNNRFGINGGGIWCDESLVTIDKCTISENTAKQGGGICFSYCWDPSPMVTNSTISGNVASDYGGAIKCYSSPMTIKDCTITGNSALGRDGVAEGGAIRCSSYSYLSIINCNISGNHTSCQPFALKSRGGAIHFTSACDSTITNSIISENSAEAPGFGGGIYAGASNLVIKNCTMKGNSAGTEGGAIYFSDNSHTITNCIFWGDTAPGGAEIFMAGRGGGSTLDVSYSDIEGGESSIHTEPGATLHWLDGNIVEEPLFEGGADYLLRTGSPCIDVGNPQPSNNDVCFPPSKGALRNDMGGYGGPEACGWCGDHDGDGHESVVCGGDDCHDTYASAYPGAEEICDGLDTDCDGTVLESESDADRDAWMICSGDCDDSDPEVYPGADEICDGKDSDCDGTVLEEELTDKDADGWPLCADCDDTNPDVNPGTGEICDNGIDEDCDGLVDLEDPDCKFTLKLERYYETGYLNLDFTLGTTVPAIWTNFMLITNPTVHVIPLWTVPLPVIDPAIEISVSFPFPGEEWIGIYTGLFTADGAQAEKRIWVYTVL